jgi:predicted Zn-dependent protease
MAGGGLGLLVWLERGRFTVTSSKLLSLDTLKAQVKKEQQQAAAQGQIATSRIHVVPSDGRMQILMTTPDQENQLGLSSYKQILAQNKLCTDPNVTDIINRVGWRLAAVAPANNFNWQFNTLSSPTVNAFCLPGGEVAVYTGILPWCQNEAALATVMGHEIAHAIARHGGERMAETGVVQGVETEFSKMLSGLGLSSLQGSALSAFGYASQLGLIWPFSRMQETEADDMGIGYMAAAGYDPNEAISFWKRMQAATDTGKSSLLSDHPASADRMQDLENKLDDAMALYEASSKFGAGDDLPQAVC